MLSLPVWTLFIGLILVAALLVVAYRAGYGAGSAATYERLRLERVLNDMGNVYNEAVISHAEIMAKAKPAPEPQQLHMMSGRMPQPPPPAWDGARREVI